MDDMMELKLLIALMVVDNITQSKSLALGFCFRLKKLDLGNHINWENKVEYVERLHIPEGKESKRETFVFAD